METSKKKLVTHNSSFHPDDLFACATLALLLEKDGKDFEIIRTRDENIIQSADFVFDVGGVYDAEKNRFDHHQKGGAGERENGIPYSSFGLVWKKFGAELCESEEVAEHIEKKLVVPIDANDSGVDLYTTNYPDVAPYTIQDVFSIFAPTALETMNKDEQFAKALVWAKEILQRKIKRSKDKIKIKEIIQGFYEKSEDKRLVVVHEPKVSRFEIWDSLQDAPEPLFVVYGDDVDWSVVAMRKEKGSFGNRKDFPAEWGGVRQEDLQKLTGISDAVFCHNNLFLAGAKSKEGAIKLAELALKG